MLKKTFTLNLTRDQLYTLIDSIAAEIDNIDDQLRDGLYDEPEFTEEKESQVNKVTELDEVYRQLLKQAE